MRECMGMGEKGETVGILITLGSRLRALPQQPRHFSRSYSAAKKKSARPPCRILRARISSTLPCLEIQPNNVDVFPNERTTCTRREQYYPKVSRQTKSIRVKVVDIVYRLFYIINSYEMFTIPLIFLSTLHFSFSHNFKFSSILS